MAAITQHEYAKTVKDPYRRGIILTSYSEEPVYGLIPFRPIAGLAYTYNQETALPAVSFRDINGTYSTTHGVVNQLVEVLKPFGGESDTDRALVRAYGKAERTSRDSMFAKAMAVKYVQTMLYGNSPAGRAGAAFTDPKSFDGIEARCTTGQVVDAGGTTGSDGSSVFAIKLGDGYCQGLQTPEGIDAEDLGILQTAPAYRARIEHIAGFGIFHGKAIGWINNIRAATTVLTRAMMDELQDKIIGKPSLYLMTKRSRRQLKDSAWGSGGPGSGAGLSIMMDDLGNPVESWGGVPIYVSDAMIDTETNS